MNLEKIKKTYTPKQADTIAHAYKTFNITGSRVVNDIAKIKKSIDYSNYIINLNGYLISFNYFKVKNILEA